VQWASLADHSAHPVLIGTLTIGSATGDAAFVGAFPAGAAAEIDATLSLYPGPRVDELAPGQGQWATISSFELVPPPQAPVPEPASWALLAAAVALWALAQRKTIGRNATPRGVG
jgi:hypothetical protein